MDAEEAFNTGAMALFEEKYGDRVRVVSLADFSKELCGGTHTQRSGNIGLFKILGESSIASGVRRIEALTGGTAVEYVQQNLTILRDSARLLKEKPEVVHQRIEKILADQKTLEKKIEKLKTQMAVMSTEDAKEQIKTINGMKVIVKKVAVDSPSALRDLADRFKEKIKSGIVVLGSTVGSKVLLIVVVSKDLASQYHAGNNR
jgi:alanyl-tRNA synthetase